MVKLRELGSEDFHSQRFLTSHESNGFRLQEFVRNDDLFNIKDQCDDAATSVSEHSNYKMRIDSMFDDSRSVHSVASTNRTRNNTHNHLLGDYHENLEGTTVRNNVQEKIEKMFEDISSSSGFETSIYLNKLTHSNEVRTGQVTNHEFNVFYLGSTPLTEKNVSLTTLQEPLKELFIRHINMDELMDKLIINKEGLKVNLKNGVLLNNFATIAVWASVKLICRTVDSTTEYAFVPLITDPEGMNKSSLYRKLSETENICLQRILKQLKSPPLFTVVMRNNALKSLECHAFICSSQEEAIIIAANLYQALMKKMKKQKDGKPSHEQPSLPPPLRPPRKCREEGQESRESAAKVDDKKTITELKKYQPSVRRCSVPNNTHSPFLGSTVSVSLRRTVSERRSGITEKVDGDILTKVAIPRSRSFLNANGPLARYSRRNKITVQSEGGGSGGGGGGELSSPLGFTELFNEFRQNEGLESMDDILNAIIDAEGMSFNDLKPIYKEFLLKLAVTLTKDELFQRSKNIMKRQRKKNRQKKPLIYASGLKKVFCKTASKLSKPKSSRPSTLEFTSVVFQSRRQNCESSTTSTSHHADLRKNKRRHASRKRMRSRMAKKKIRSVGSDESGSLGKNNGNESGGCPNRSSSGYFSCSECSYDSENCTCISADKCYCALGRGRRLEKEDKASVTTCGFDTESCVESHKCYCEQTVPCHNDPAGVCQTPHLHQERSHRVNCPLNFNDKKKDNLTIFDQLKEQGFVASDSSLSRAASPLSVKGKAKHTECVKTSQSLEFLQMRPVRKSITRPQVQEYLTPPLMERVTRLGKFVEGTRHFCYHGSDAEVTQNSRRQYSSMRVKMKGSQLETDCKRQRARAFSSMRVRPLSEETKYRTLFQEKDNNNTCNSSLRFPKRIDVYSTQKGNLLARNICAENKFFANKDSTSKLQINQFTADFPQINENSFCGQSFGDRMKERKVLVVSARDPKGNVLYMGASSRGEYTKSQSRDRNAANALSVKKSAEIAALFTDMCSKQKANRTSSMRDIKVQSHLNPYLCGNMESTLGYLP